MGEYTNICLTLLKNTQSVKMKSAVYAYIISMLTEKAGTMFQSMSDTFTSPVGLDVFLTDLQNEELRPLVLQTFCHLMAHNDEVCVKVLKLKLVSNVLAHFVVNADPESVDITDEALALLEAAAKCKHWETLLTKSDQFKAEKQRLTEFVSAKKLGKILHAKLEEMLRVK